MARKKDSGPQGLPGLGLFLWVGEKPGKRGLKEGVESRVADSNLRIAAGLRSRKGEVQGMYQEAEPGSGLQGGASSRH